jgi:hypothetical protein
MLKASLLIFFNLIAPFRIINKKETLGSGGLTLRVNRVEAGELKKKIKAEIVFFSFLFKEILIHIYIKLILI